MALLTQNAVHLDIEHSVLELLTSKHGLLAADDMEAGHKDIVLTISMTEATTTSNNEWVCVEDVRIRHRPCRVAQTQSTCKQQT